MAVTDQQKKELKALLASGRKIEAIQYVRQNFKLGLLQSKTLIDHIEEEMEPSEFDQIVNGQVPAMAKRGCGGKVLSMFFASIGFLMLGMAVFIYMDQIKQINESVLVVGTVISNPAQPTIEFSFKGEIYRCSASVNSTPPAYNIGEEVEVFIHKNDPNITLINTNTERGFIIILMGGMGLLFSGIGLLVYKML